MNKRFIIAGPVLLAASMVGCVTSRTYVMEKPRVDMTVEGNRGYIMGVAPEETVSAELQQKRERLGDKRKIDVLELDLSTKTTTTTYKNAPVCIDVTGSQPAPARAEENVLFNEPIAEPQEEPVRIAEPAKKPAPAVTSYTVQKNDTLQKISMKFYGTSKKWYSLYKENSNVLKAPDKLRPGQVIRIPKFQK